MSKYSNLKKNRVFEMDKFGNVVKRVEPIPVAPRRQGELDCGGVKFKISASPGQLINKDKMCKRLLKEHYKNN